MSKQSDREELDEGRLVVILSYGAAIYLPWLASSGKTEFFITAVCLVVITWLFLRGWLWK